jgi:rsbT co-antagonist protein RsbR
MDLGNKALARAFDTQRDAILSAWLAILKPSDAFRSGRLKEAELKTQAAQVLDLLRLSVGSGERDEASYASLKALLGEISKSRAIQGSTPRDTALFVFSLKEPLFAVLNAETGTAQAAGIVAASKLIDDLGLYTMEVFQTSREDIIGRQSQEIADLSTPVVRLWDGILALPLIGTLDSSRTGIVMENLLQAIVDEEAQIAIIDITGVPTVDTLVAQHLLKTIAAARMMGADCIISGIRPQIAQTMVHLGVELNVVSKATLADAFKLALKRIGGAVSQPGQRD